MMRMSVTPVPSTTPAGVAVAGNAAATAAPSDVWVRSLPLWHIWNIGTIVAGTALALRFYLAVERMRFRLLKLGLRGLADRVEALGGRLAVDSPPGGGTRVIAELPCG